MSPLKRLASLLLFVFLTPLNATTVILVHNPSGAILASDSKISSIDGKESRFGCKIHIAENYIWASTGLAFETNGPYDIEKLMPSLMGSGIPFDASVQRLKVRFATPFRKLLRDVKKMGFDPSKQKVEIILVNKRNPSHVSIVTATQKGLIRKDCPGRECGASNIVAFGENSAIKKIMDARPIFQEMNSPPRTVDYLIQQQEIVSPDRVGGKVSILLIDSGGPKWIQKGECQ